MALQATNGTTSAVSEPITETAVQSTVVQKQEAHSPYGAEESHNQADVDSEVSQINTQSQQVTDGGQTEFKRPQSRSSSSAVSSNLHETQDLFAFDISKIKYISRVKDWDDLKAKWHKQLPAMKPPVLNNCH